MHHGVLHDQAGQTVMGFHDCHQALHVQQAAQPSPAHIRHGQFRPFPALEFPVFLIMAVGIFHQFSTIGRQDGNHFIPDRLLEPGTPVIPVNNDVRMILLQVFPVTEGPLFHHFGDTGNILKQAHPFRFRNQREPLIGSHRLIRKDADHQFSQPLCPADDLDVPAVNNV